MPNNFNKLLEKISGSGLCRPVKKTDTHDSRPGHERAVACRLRAGNPWVRLSARPLAEARATRHAIQPDVKNTVDFGRYWDPGGRNLALRCSGWPVLAEHPHRCALMAAAFDLAAVAA